MGKFNGNDGNFVLRQTDIATIYEIPKYLINYIPGNHLNSYILSL